MDKERRSAERRADDEDQREIEARVQALETRVEVLESRLGPVGGSA